MRHDKIEAECKWCGDRADGWYFCSQLCRVAWHASPQTRLLGRPKMLRNTDY